MVLPFDTPEPRIPKRMLYRRSEIQKFIPTSIFREHELDPTHHGTAYKLEFAVEPPEEIRENDLLQKPMVVRVRSLENAKPWCPVEIQIHVKVFHAVGSDRFEVCRKIGRHDMGGVYSVSQSPKGTTSHFMTVRLASPVEEFEVAFDRFHKEGLYVLYVILALGPTDTSPRTRREAWVKCKKPITVTSMPQEKQQNLAERC
ncbi:hypothetical protein EMPG_12240 [Blastomyces silverae]|uniref:Uncharacterized protein n=1 Tax=Blastomyces silverae TaxID=2060906 RepID=A0A0H1BNR6_9EURO|nr:hypothetical protein EMPG_12240 [Blastomyces silverae]